MLCTVYRLYADGVRLAPEAAKGSAAQGWLTYRTKMPGTGMPFPHANLLPHQGADARYPVIPRLEHAHLMLCDGGMRLVGQDWNLDHRYIKQAWWAVPLPPA